MAGKCTGSLTGFEVKSKWAVLLFFSSVFHLFSGCEAQLNSNRLLLPGLFPTTNNAAATSTGLQYRQREVLNPSTNTVLEWEVNRAANSITFNYSTTLNSNAPANTVLLFGLSLSGWVQGSDVVAIGGIGQPQPYLVDMHGADNTTLVRDNNQNWRLVNFRRTSSGISVTVSRLLDTCDNQDITINNDLVRIIWGSSTATASASSMRFVPNGNVRAYLTDPMNPTRVGGTAIQRWRLTRTFRIPPRHTSYWCTIHRGPSLPRKHHIVGFSAHFGDELARKHIHHQLVYRCQAPPGMDPALIFDKYVNHPGEECYLEENHQLPTIFCTEILHSWGVGGKPFNFPDDMGISLGETRNEYYLYEAHYDNPEIRSDLVVENGVNLEYTSVLRPNEGGILITGAGVMGLFQVPPNAKNFTMAGHCSSECTRQMLPATGMEIVATMLHAHMTTRRITLKNHRGNRELPWVQSDHNYDYSFQQMRLLPQPVTILPGDQMTTECVYDTSSRTNMTLSGFSTTDEMCITFIVVKKRVPYLYCTSEYPTERSMQMYGVRNMTWNRERQERVVTSANNPNFNGQSLSQVIDQSVGNWNSAMIRDLEREQLYSQHDAACPAVRLMAVLAYAELAAQTLTFGLINATARIEETRPSTRTISTPPGLRTNLVANYPSRATLYRPPRVPCSSG